LQARAQAHRPRFLPLKARKIGVLSLFLGSPTAHHRDLVATVLCFLKVEGKRSTLHPLTKALDCIHHPRTHWSVLGC
jgi:hypothetical protein